MIQRIADFLRSRKGGDSITVLTILIVGCCSFALGRLSTQPAHQFPVVLRIPEATAHEVTANASFANSPLPTNPHNTPTPGEASVGAGYVASKNGTVYHLPWCAGAKRIKPENKVWFKSKAEAEAAGLRPASNCKGI